MSFYSLRSPVDRLTLVRFFILPERPVRRAPGLLIETGVTLTASKISAYPGFVTGSRAINPLLPI